MVIKVKVRTNVIKETYNVESGTTLRTFLEDVGVDYAKGFLTVDGTSLAPGDIDKTFDDLHIAEKCFVNQVVKADNAIIL